jgi:tetratricopeptide (TPR) repeat protein
MKLLTSLLVIALIAFANFSQEPAPSQKQSVNPELERELNQIASLYRTGNFAEAQRHAERAVSLDPANLQAAIFLARVRHQRYTPADDQPQNLEMARAAIDAYQTVLTLDSQNEEAYKAIAVLYASTHQEELLKAWVLQRAVNAQVSNQKRAEAYAVLASKNWDCSFRFTELPDHKLVDSTKSGAVITYKMGDDLAEFQRIKQCVTNGLEMADAALLLDYDSETAWAYKTNLFLEAAKLAEMEGMDLAKANYLKEANQAQVQTNRLAVEGRRREEEGASGPTPNPRPSPPPRISPTPSHR